MTAMHIKSGSIVRDRKRSLAHGVAIVVGPGRVAGQFRICRWRGGAQHWSLPAVIRKERLAPIPDWTLLPLTDAKRLAAAAFERNYLVHALAAAQGSLLDAARASQVDRSNFRRLLQRHGLVKRPPRPSRQRRWKKGRPR